MFDLSRLRKAWLLPLLVFQSYLAFVLLMYFIGPWPWAQYNTTKLLIFLIVAQASILIGYLAAWPRVSSAAAMLGPDERAAYLQQGLMFFQLSFWIFLVMLLPTSLSRSGAIIPDVMRGIANTGEVYNANYDRIISGNPYVAVEYLRIVLSPFLLAFFPLVIIFWERIPTWQKFTSVAMYLYFVAIYIAIGTNKAIIDSILLLPAFIYVARVSGSGGLHIPRWVFRAVFILMFVAFLVFFGRGQEERAGGVGVSGYFNSGITLIQADSGVLENWMTPSQRIAYESLTRYLTSGYYALSLSFDVPHQTTYGLGSSMFMAGQADAALGSNFFTTESIPGQMEQQIGFPQFMLWHSIYPWLASDVGYIGAIVAVGLFSYLLGLSWGFSIVRLDVRYVILASLMLILFIYIPANNQIFQSGESCVGLLIVLIWLAVSGNSHWRHRLGGRRAGASGDSADRPGVRRRR